MVRKRGGERRSEGEGEVYRSWGEGEGEGEGEDEAGRRRCVRLGRGRGRDAVSVSVRDPFTQPGALRFPFARVDGLGPASALSASSGGEGGRGRELLQCVGEGKAS